jgi:hypothetical protein
MFPASIYFISDGDIKYFCITLFKFQNPTSIFTERQNSVPKLEQLVLFCNDLEKNINQSEEKTNLLLQTVLRKALEGKDEK